MTMPALAYRVETGLRRRLSRRARDRGWTPAVLPYPGYGGHGRVRVLGRIVLAPVGTDPAARRGIPGWQRLLTLELPDVDVEVSVGGQSTTARSDEAGLLDVTLTSSPSAGPAEAVLAVAERSTTAVLHVAADSSRMGVVCDIDDTVWVTGLHHPLRAAWRTMARASGGRRAVPGMSNLVNGVTALEPGGPVVYLSNGPWNLAGPVTRFLERKGFPAGALLMTDWGITPRTWFRDGRAHKRSSLQRLAQDFPDVRWVLLGDTGEHDPELYAAFAEQHPGRVAAIGLRQVQPGTDAAPSTQAAGVPVHRGADGDRLLELLLPDLAEKAGRSAPGGGAQA